MIKIRVLVFHFQVNFESFKLFYVFITECDAERDVMQPRICGKTKVLSLN